MNIGKSYSSDWCFVVFLDVRVLCSVLLFSFVEGVKEMLWAARPSSLYEPMFLPNRFSSELRMNSPTSSHISAPSKLPMVTSKLFGVFRFVHAFPLLKSSDLRACLIALTSSSGMVVYFVAHDSASSSNSSDIEE